MHDGEAGTGLGLTELDKLTGQDLKGRVEQITGGWKRVPGNASRSFQTATPALDSTAG